MRTANASEEDEYNGLFKITLAALFCKTCKLDKDGNGVKFDNVGPMEPFQILMLSQQKSPKIILVSVP